MIQTYFGKMLIKQVQAGKKYQLDATGEKLLAIKLPTPYFEPEKTIDELVLRKSNIAHTPAGSFTACFERDAALGINERGKTFKLALPVILKVAGGEVGLTEIQ